MNIKFSKCIVSNMTCLGKTFSASGNIKLYKLAKIIDIDDRITGIKYAKRFKYNIDTDSKYIYYKLNKFKNPWFINNNCKNNTILNGIAYELIDGYLTVKIKKGNMIKKKKKKGRKSFKNSITLIIDKSINCKICTNGKIHTTGCKSKEKCLEILKLLQKYFIAISKFNLNRLHIKYYDKFKFGGDIKITRHVLTSVSDELKEHRYITLDDIKEKYPSYYKDVKDKLFKIKNSEIIRKKMIFFGDINVSFRYTAMIMSHFRIIDDEIELDQNKLFKYINYVNRSDMFPTFRNIKKKILQLDYTDKEGIIITYLIFRSGKINMTNCKHIKQVERCYKFITTFINDNIKYFKLYDIVDRAIDYINCPIKQRSKEWLELRKKCITASDSYKAIMKTPPFYQNIDRLVNDKVYGSKFKGNDATFFGTLFEPIAQKLLPKLYNNNIYIYEAGFYISKKNPFIGASPDGILIKYDKRFPKNKIKENKDKILDVCLVEIKCPFKSYKPIKKSVFLEKEHYYWQIQQQLYVTGFKYCVFIQCNFKHYKNEKEYKLDTVTKYKGVYIIFKKNAKIIYLTPEWYKHIYHIKNKYECYVKYWKLIDYDITEVDFDKIIFKRKIKKLKKAYDLILEERKNMYKEDY